LEVYLNIFYKMEEYVSRVKAMSIDGTGVVMDELSYSQAQDLLDDTILPAQ
jgi:hypothetical protein